MRKTIRRVLPKNEKQYQHDWHIKNRERQPSFDSERECPADRILGNQAMMQHLSLKVETEGEKATALQWHCMLLITAAYKREIRF